MDSAGWSDVTFHGQYPVATVAYADASEKRIAAKLEAFSPFVPLSAEDSSYPATVLRYTFTNLTAAPLAIEVSASLQNAVLMNSGTAGATLQSNDCSNGTMRCLQLSAASDDPAVQQRPDFGSMAIAVLGSDPADQLIQPTTQPSGISPHRDIPQTAHDRAE